MAKPRTKKSFFKTPFTLATVGYALAFAMLIYSTSTSAGIRMGAIMLVLGLPAVLASELAGKDTQLASALVESWRKEFAGTVVMVALTCSPGPALGHLGAAIEWTTHWAMMALADFSCGGPQVNPAVTLALWTTGGFGMDLATALVNCCAQTAGALVGWQLLLVSGGVFPNPVGGPGPASGVPLFYLAACEAVACWTLLAGVFCFATTRPFQTQGNVVYGAKMTLINMTVRLLIVMHGTTGPALNPALATGWAVAAGDGLLPGSEHFYVYWLGGILGACAFAQIWTIIAKPPSKPSTSFFPGDICTIIVGAYLGLFATCLWVAKYAPEIDAILAGPAQAPAERNLAQKTGLLFTKVFRPKKHKAIIAA